MGLSFSVVLQVRVLVDDICFDHTHIFFPCCNHNTAETHNQLCVLTDRKINGSRDACKLCKGTFLPSGQSLTFLLTVSMWTYFSILHLEPFKKGTEGQK